MFRVLVFLPLAACAQPQEVAEPVSDNPCVLISQAYANPLATRIDRRMLEKRAEELGCI